MTLLEDIIQRMKSGNTGRGAPTDSRQARSQSLTPGAPAGCAPDMPQRLQKSAAEIREWMLTKVGEDISTSNSLQSAGINPLPTEAKAMPIKARVQGSAPMTRQNFKPAQELPPKPSVTEQGNVRGTVEQDSEPILPWTGHGKNTGFVTDSANETGDKQMILDKLKTSSLGEESARNAVPVKDMRPAANFQTGPIGDAAQNTLGQSGPRQQGYTYRPSDIVRPHTPNIPHSKTWGNSSAQTTA